MIARELLGTAPVPGPVPGSLSGEELRLFRHGRDHMIVLGGNELMNTRQSGSEEALATLTCARLAGRRAPHLLIGGYGMGFTLRAALGVLDAKARLTVAELVPQIIGWARGPMADLTAGCLDDPRVRLIEDDVARLIQNGEGCYDAILLDVDNGPDGLTRPANSKLYSMRGLHSAREALTPGGALAVWSAARDPAFTRRLGDAGFAVEEIPVRARSNGKGAHHVIWLATAP
jgi:spermidine synthase